MNPIWPIMDNVSLFIHNRHMVSPWIMDESRIRRIRKILFHRKLHINYKRELSKKHHSQLLESNEEAYTIWFNDKTFSSDDTIVFMRNSKQLSTQIPHHMNIRINKRRNARASVIFRQLELDSAWEGKILVTTGGEGGRGWGGQS